MREMFGDFPKAAAFWLFRCPEFPAPELAFPVPLRQPRLPVGLFHAAVQIAELSEPPTCTILEGGKPVAVDAGVSGSCVLTLRRRLDAQAPSHRG